MKRGTLLLSGLLVVSVLFSMMTVVSVIGTIKSAVDEHNLHVFTHSAGRNPNEYDHVDVVPAAIGESVFFGAVTAMLWRAFVGRLSKYRLRLEEDDRWLREQEEMRRQALLNGKIWPPPPP